MTIGFVLVHGGGMTSTMWDPLLPLLRHRTVAVDLPGRRYQPQDLATVTTADMVEGIARACEKAPFDELVVAGHSMAGYCLPYLPARLPGLRHLVFVCATVAAPGQRPIDQLRPGLRQRILRRADPVIESVAGKTIDGRRPGEPSIETDLIVVRDDVVLDAGQPTFEVAAWPPLPAELPRTWVYATQDRVIPPERSLAMARAVEPAALVEVEGGHDPTPWFGELAQRLDAIAARAE